MALTNDDPPALGRLKEIRDAVRVKRIADAPGPELGALLDKVRGAAYKVTDDDFQRVLGSGVSQEDTYEAVTGPDAAFVSSGKSLLKFGYKL